MTSRFTKLFYCERANIAHIQSGDTLACACTTSLGFQYHARARGTFIRMIVLGFKLLNETSQLCSVKNYIIIIIVGTTSGGMVDQTR